MDKLTAQKRQLLKAQAFLQHALAYPASDIQRAATIQAFEFCFELAWKYLKAIVEDDGSIAASPKAAFREAARHGIIDNPEVWFELLQARNLTVDTYVEAVAQQVYEAIKQQFVPVLATLIDTSEDM